MPLESLSGSKAATGRALENPSRRRIATYFLLVVGAIVFAMPLMVMIFTSFKSFGEINTFPPTIIPKGWLPRLAEAWTYPNTDFPRWTLNTLPIFVFTLPGVVLNSSLCAMALPAFGSRVAISGSPW